MIVSAAANQIDLLVDRGVGWVPFANGKAVSGAAGDAYYSIDCHERRETSRREVPRLEGGRMRISEIFGFGSDSYRSSGRSKRSGRGRGRSYGGRRSGGRSYGGRRSRGGGLRISIGGY